MNATEPMTPNIMSPAITRMELTPLGCILVVRDDEPILFLVSIEMFLHW